MSAAFFYGVVGTVIFAAGFHGLIRYAHFLRKAIAFNVMGAGIFTFLVALAARDFGGPPDFIPQAMVLTGIVVSVSATAFVLALASKLFTMTGGTDLESSGKSDGGGAVS